MYVFAAGDLLWYPVEGHPEIRVAPDVTVVFGRPKGERGSYRQWEEDNMTPQVVFEILSPGHTFKEMTQKLKFYDRYRVEEYYVYDPEGSELTRLQRREGELAMIEEMNDWVSPRLGIRFGWVEGHLTLYYPNGRPFLVELAQRLAQSEQRAQQIEQRAERLAAHLRALGVEPEVCCL